MKVLIREDGRELVQQCAHRLIRRLAQRVERRLVHTVLETLHVDSYTLWTRHHRLWQAERPSACVRGHIELRHNADTALERCSDHRTHVGGAVRE